MLCKGRKKSAEVGGVVRRRVVCGKELAVEKFSTLVLN
jgi:hypothetical protein